MPRQTAHINVPFGAGADEKTDARALATGQWGIVRNAQFTKRGSLRQRAGYLATSKSVAGGGGLTIGGPVQNLSVFRDSLVSVDTNSFLSAKQATAAGDLWSRAVRISDASIRRTQVEDTALGQNTPDVASNGSYVVRTWMNNMAGAFPNQYGDVYVSVHDAVTGATVLQPTLIFALCTGAKIAIVGSVCIIVAWSALGGVYRYVSTTLGTAPSFSVSVNLPVTNAADTIYGFTFDWLALSDRFVIAYQPATDNGIQLESFSTLAVSLATRKLTDANADGTLCIAMTKDLSDNVYLAYESNDTVSINTAGTAKLSNALVVSYGPTALPAGMIAPALPYYLSLLFLSSGALMVVLTAVANTANSGMYCQLLNPATGGALGSTVFTPGIVHVTRPFFFGSTAYVVASFNATIDSGGISTQPTFFVLDIGSTAGAAQARPVGTIAPRIATYGGRAISSSCSVYSSGNRYTTLINAVVDGLARDGRSSLMQVDIEFRDVNSMLSGYCGDSLLIGTGCPTAYDGLKAYEYGFLLYPEGVTASTATVGGTIQDGTYLYSVVYEYIDNVGQRHQSAPSPTISVTFSSGSNTNRVTLTVPSLQITAKSNNDVSVVVYRTLVNSTTFHRVTSDVVPAANRNQIGTTSFTIVDSTSDVGLGLAARPVLYTTGGELPNFCPPSADIVIQHKGRTWLASTDEGKSVWFSKPVVPSFAPGFNETFSIYFADGGRVTGLASLDDKLVVFKSDRIFVVYGDGPNALGSGSEYQIQTIATDEGCVAPRSVVVCPLGVLFQGHKGLMLLSRDLQVSYIGAAVEDTALSSTITSAVQVAELNQVRFTITGLTLVFDYYQQQWATWPIYDDNNNAVATAGSAVKYGGVYHWAGASGMTYYESASTPYDGSNSHMVAMQVQSAWIRSSSIAGFQRVNRVFLICEGLTNCDVNLGVALDYTTTSTIATFSPLNAQVSQFELVPVAGKCEAMQFTITTVPSAGATPVALLGLDLEVQLDSRSYKGLGQSQRR